MRSTPSCRTSSSRRVRRCLRSFKVKLEGTSALSRMSCIWRMGTKWRLSASCPNTLAFVVVQLRGRVCQSLMSCMCRLNNTTSPPAAYV
eukprot:1151824-Pelagomonas_calceolata.AAC.1